MRGRVLGAPGAPANLRFAHVLIRDVLYEEIPATHRIRLHRRVAEVLERCTRQPGPHLAELAYHFSTAVPAGTWPAIDYARRAGDRAVDQLAFQEAARLYQLAIQALELDPDERPGGAAACPGRCRIGLATPAAKGTSVRRRAGRRPPPRLLALAALGYGGRTVSLAGPDHHLIELLDAALAAWERADCVAGEAACASVGRAAPRARSGAA